MALAGVKVLDLTRFQNGPHATALLSDLGADVVKVEQPGVGDTGRGFLSHRNGFSGYNEALNRGKRSVELDLKSRAARPVIEKLVRWADVLCENYKVGVMDRLGWGYEACRKLNPRLIYCTNSGFGPEGPWANRGSFDTICQGMSGAAVAQGGGPSHQPIFVEWGAADQVGAMSFALHITAAIVARGRTGVGQKVECSQLGAMVQFQSISNVGSWYTGAQANHPPDAPIQRDDGNLSGIRNSIALTYYKCGDGKLLTAAPCMEEKHFPMFCKALGLDDLPEDPRMARGKRWRNSDYLRERVEAALASNTRDHWVDAIAAAGVPTGPVLDYKDLAAHPQVRANGYVTEVENQYGKFPTAGVAARYSGTPAPPVGTAADLGEHTEEVLREVCGLDAAEVSALAAAHATTPSSDGYTKPHWMSRHRWKQGKEKARL